MLLVKHTRILESKQFAGLLYNRPRKLACEYLNISIKRCYFERSQWNLFAEVFFTSSSHFKLLSSHERKTLCHCLLPFYVTAVFNSIREYFGKHMKTKVIPVPSCSKQIRITKMYRVIQLLVSGLRSFCSMVFSFQEQRVISLCNWLKERVY